MKRVQIFAVAFVITVCVTTTTAQEQIPGDAGYRVFADLKSYQELDLEKCGKNFLASLNYASCNQIIECGLAQIAMLKLAQPKVELRALKDKVEELAIHGNTPAIRYKAYLTSMVFEDPELFVYEKYGEYDDGSGLFTALAQRLQKEALAVR